MSTTTSKATDNAARRRFLADTLRTAVGVGLVAVTLGVYQRQARALPATAIRPPGVTDEKSFSQPYPLRPVRPRDCPYDTLKLAELGDDVALGTRYFGPVMSRARCVTTSRVKACPTGALNPALKEINGPGWAWLWSWIRRPASRFRACAASLLQRLPGAEARRSRSTLSAQ